MPVTAKAKVISPSIPARTRVRTENPRRAYLVPSGAFASCWASSGILIIVVIRTVVVKIVVIVIVVGVRRRQRLDRC